MSSRRFVAEAERAEGQRELQGDAEGLTTTSGTLEAASLRVEATQVTLDLAATIAKIAAACAQP